MPADAELAPAKVNLTLHVTGRRADGYHLIDSLVVFPHLGDLVEADPAPIVSLALRGRFAVELDAGGNNLVLRAAALMAGAGRGAALCLTKSLPVASGLGGGSADAAATLRLLARLWGSPLPPDAAVLGLGADVPVCLAGRACRMTGVGERLEPVAVPTLWLVLANPGVRVATAAVFGGLRHHGGPPMPPLPTFDGFDALVDYLAGQRNDLESPASAAVPPIAEVRAALAAQPGCRLARMSGSGATCFGLFAREGPARSAAAAIGRARPGWWLAAAPVA
jgi:4-diphosphocytidyl-2-C-methyl-D-erythritol kinase